MTPQTLSTSPPPIRGRCEMCHDPANVLVNAPLLDATYLGPDETPLDPRDAPPSKLCACCAFALLRKAALVEAVT
jgi:hypothetical protein